MAQVIRMTKNGIRCRLGSRTVLLDPKAADPTAVNFVSHAHIDHLPAGGGAGGASGGTLSGAERFLMLASRQTRQIASVRGFEMANHTERADGFELVDSGHILGSRGLLFDDIFYTGDICTRDRGFLRGAQVPKCKILITECTFGLPEFAFPSTKDVVERANRIISDLYGRGVPVILMGYQLGKAQTLTRLFGHWQPLYFYDSVLEMNRLHEELGVGLSEGVGHTEAESLGLLEKKPWVMISPMMSEKTKFIQRMKSRYGAVTMGFSGWARSTRFAFGRRADYSIPMSDHCDYEELVRMVKQSGAGVVYTTHGFESEFAESLRSLGIAAEPLGRANGKR